MSHTTETRNWAENLYVMKGLGRTQVSRITGVCERQIATWAKANDWREQRRKYQEASAGIERNLALLRSRLAEKALDTLDPKLAGALARLQALALGVKDPDEYLDLPSEDEPSDPTAANKANVGALQKIVDRRIRMCLDQPRSLTADVVRDLKDTMDLVDRLKVKYKTENKPKGLSNEMAEEIRRKILGIPPDDEPVKRHIPAENVRNRAENERKPCEKRE